MATLLWIIAFVLMIAFMGFFNLGLAASSLILAFYLTLLTLYFGFGPAILSLIVSFIVLALIFNIKALRRWMLSRFLLNVAKKAIPKLSKTEEQALGAGSVSFEGQLFLGQPNFKEMLLQKPAALSKEEQEFLDGPTEELCLMLDDYQIFKDEDLSAKTWQFIKDKGFLSMIIPKKYGGLEFSASAHSAVIVKLGSRNIPAAISVGVPNSLGPAELLLRYGTEEQKDYYLPRLARGEEIPCFALTGPRAGSDAASIPDCGVLCFQEYNGIRTLGIRLNWDKRYITLAPVATLIGLAFKLRDPDHLLFKKVEQGITCALIPRDLPGIEIGKRHYPFNIMFQNGPTTGTDVFIPLDQVIGGQAMIGQGWRMLMECLGAGRAITLPSAGSGSAMVAALASGCYARIRHQFGLPIGRFEGVKEALARIGANAYLNLASLKFILASLDQKEEPAVASAIVKYHTTERSRQAVNDAMDIHGGKGICLGPKNYLAPLYRCAPINITVEGANILTRNMIIFGQGFIRCHPYMLKEMKAVAKQDVVSFDRLLFQHIGFIYKNFIRSWTYGLTGTLLIKAPKSRVKKRFKQLSRYSAVFAFLADAVALSLGARLKRMENISAKLGDILSFMYLASACLKRFHDEGQKTGDEAIIAYICDNLFFDIEQRFRDICDNLPNKCLGQFFYCVIFPSGTRQRKASDGLAHDLADLMLYPSESFSRMTSGIFKGATGNNFITLLMDAQKKVIAAEELEKRVFKALKQNLITGLSEEDLVIDALGKEMISKEESEQLIEVARIRAEIVAVDAF